MSDQNDDWYEHECDECGTVITKDEYDSQEGKCNNCYWNEGEENAPKKETSS